MLLQVIQIVKLNVLYIFNVPGLLCSQIGDSHGPLPVLCQWLRVKLQNLTFTSICDSVLDENFIWALFSWGLNMSWVWNVSGPFWDT